MRVYAPTGQLVEACVKQDRVDHQGGRDRRPLRGRQGREDDQLRRLRRADQGHRRPASHLQREARRACRHRRGRAQLGRRDRRHRGRGRQGARPHRPAPHRGPRRRRQERRGAGRRRHRRSGAARATARRRRTRRRPRRTVAAAADAAATAVAESAVEPLLRRPAHRARLGDPGRHRGRSLGALGRPRALGEDRLARRDARSGGRLAFPRAPAVQGHEALFGDRDRRDLRRDRRLGERRDQQGVHAPLRALPRHPHRARPSTCSRRCCSARPSRRSTPSARSCSRRSRCTRTSPPTRSTTSSTRPSSATTRSAGACSATAEVISSIPVPDIGAYHDARYTGAEHRRRRGRQPRARRDRRARSRSTSSPSAGERQRQRSSRPTASRRRVCFQQKDTEQYHVCFGGPGHRPRRRAPLRPRDPRLHLRRLDLVAALPRGAREARPRLRRRLLHAAVRRQRPGRPLRRHPRGQRRGGLRGDRQRARAASTPTGSPTTSWPAPRRASRAGWSSRASRPAPACRGSPARSCSTPSCSPSTRCSPGSTPSASTTSPSSPRELYAPEPLSAAAIAPDEDRFRKALAPVSEPLRRRSVGLRPMAEPIQVVVSGAAGRMGATVCEAGRGGRRAGAAPRRADPGARDAPAGGGARRAPT